MIIQLSPCSKVFDLRGGDASYWVIVTLRNELLEWILVWSYLRHSKFIFELLCVVLVGWNVGFNFARTREKWK